MSAMASERLSDPFSAAHAVEFVEEFPVERNAESGDGFHRCYGYI